MERSSLEAEYKNRLRTYERIAEEAAHVLEDGLTKRKIKFQSVLRRIKTFSSFADKVDRRQTENPFVDITDQVGLRIVCLLRSDLARIADLIRESFVVVAEDDKLETQPVASFGYLSVHFVVKLKPEFKGPRYDGLHDQPFEIQVRTIAMDAWAAVSHYLDYKTDVDVPSPLRKDFQALSGLFYLADTHFEMFYDARRRSEAATKELFERRGSASEQELNYDTLLALLHKRFPERRHLGSGHVSVLLGELTKQGYRTVASLERQLDRSAEAFKRFERERSSGRFAAVGVVRISLQIADPAYRDSGKVPNNHYDEYVKYLK